MKRTALFLSILLAIVLIALPLEPVQAGCCLVISLDKLPQSIVAGEAVTISYTARLTVDRSQIPFQIQQTIKAIHTESKEELTVEAEAVEGEKGRFQATLVFPRAGQWQWQLGNRSMPPLMVQSAAVGSEPATGGSLAPLAGLAGLLATAVGLFLWLQRRTPYRLAFMLLAILVATGGFVLQAVPGTVLAERERAAPAIAPEGMGEALFVAKGCITCHQHGGLSIDTWMGHIGPELTHYQGNPDFLRRWLSDPRAVRPDTFMPNLGLSQAEIEALVVFLAADAG